MSCTQINFFLISHSYNYSTKGYNKSQLLELSAGVLIGIQPTRRYSNDKEKSETLQVDIDTIMRRQH